MDTLAKKEKKRIANTIGCYHNSKKNGEYKRVVITTLKRENSEYNRVVITTLKKYAKRDKEDALHLEKCQF